MRKELLFTIFLSTQTLALENIASISKKIETVQTVISELNVSKCVQKLDVIHNRFYNIRSTDINIDRNKKEKINNMIRRSFNTRLLLLETARNNPSLAEDRSCLLAMKRIDNVLRYLEDYLVLIVVPPIDKRESEVISLLNQYILSLNSSLPLPLPSSLVSKLSSRFTTLEGSFPILITSPNYSDFDSVEELKSGDLLISRGNAFTSAAIARISEDESQFSHASFVYQGENGLETTEAHIEIGAVVAPIQVHIDQGNARTVVLRHRDSDFAHQASSLIYDKVKEVQDQGRPYLYDFEQDYSNADTMFCTEIIYLGFFYASKGEVEVPLYPSKFKLGIGDFINGLGTEINEENHASFNVLSPRDLIFDPMFELVAEWRHPDKIYPSIKRDVILTALVDWMAQYDYTFQFSPGVKGKASIVKALHRYLKHIPENMTRTQLKYVINLRSISQTLLDVINAANPKDVLLTPIELREILEKFRKDDLAKPWWRSKIRRALKR